MLRAIEQRLTGLVTTAGAGDWYLFYDRTGDPARAAVPVLHAHDR
jgi:hypothetical protein